MTSRHPYIHIAHRSHGRIRLRLPWLKREPGNADPLAERLGAVQGVRQVEVRTRTGSVLVEFDPDLVAEQALLEVAQSTAGAEKVAARGEADATPEWPDGEADHDGHALARAMKRFFVELNGDVVRLSGGSLNLGTASALGLLTFGLGEVVATGRIPLPQWFNVSWWGFRTFMTFEKDVEELEAASADVRH